MSRIHHYYMIYYLLHENLMEGIGLWIEKDSLYSIQV